MVKSRSCSLLNRNSIVTNVQLHGFGIVASNCCVFCSEEPETIIHLFCDCKFVDIFWNDIFDWLSVKFHCDFNLEHRHKLFGFEGKNSIFQFLNGLLLYARFLIYRCKYSKLRPNMMQYFNLIDSIKHSEYFIAKMKNKLDLHFRKWSYLQ